MSTRLPIDQYVQGYWGFDEANVADVAVDETAHGNDLTVTAATAVVPARLGNGRQFDGANTFARPVSSVLFRSAVASRTIIVWAIADSFNAVGDLLRPIVVLDGPGGGAADAEAYGLFVLNTGAVIWRYTDLNGDQVVHTSGANTVRTGRYYSLSVVTDNVGPATATVSRLRVNNEAVLWAAQTVGGVPQADPNAATTGLGFSGANTVLTVGGSSKSASRWHGVLDELSIHTVARAVYSYLRDAYFRLTLSTNFQRLTATSNIKTLGTVEMGGGTRWWCYERDQNLYVIRENSLGLFGAEVKLTTGGTMWNGAELPGGVTMPALAYDAATDVLLVAFRSAGTVYKITAASVDLPSTQVMPYTQDTAGIIKVADTVDVARMGMGQMPDARGLTVPALYGNDAATVRLMHTPSFGVAIYGNNTNGYVVYKRVGNIETVLGYAVGAKQTAQWGPVYTDNYWFLPVAARQAGTSYYAYPLDWTRQTVLDNPSNTVTDFLGEFVVGRDARLGAAFENLVVFSRDGDYPHEHYTAWQGQANTREGDMVFVNATPVKVLLTDAFSQAEGEGGQRSGDFIHVNATPVKQMVYDSLSLGADESTLFYASPDTLKIGVAL